MESTARDWLVPQDTTTFRTAFLYVGQGDASLHVIPDGQGGFLYVLVDINLDPERGGTDVVALLEDLLPRENGRPVLDLYISTHPHNDHISGIDLVTERIRVRAVWHTGFKPGQKHKDRFKHFQAFLDRVEDEGGEVFEYQGTRSERDLGEVTVEIVSPAEHVKDEIDDLSGGERYKRIHEYCGVFRFGYGREPKHVLQPGDADRKAWKDHILGSNEYHDGRIPSALLNAAHHGSNSFFYNGDPDSEEPYTRALELIRPTWVVISTPEDSPFDHPHDEALAIYRDQVGTDNVLILGDGRECVIYDIYEDGQHDLHTDRGQLAEDYSLDGDDSGDGDDGNEEQAASYIGTQVDSGRPMG